MPKGVAPRGYTCKRCGSKFGSFSALGFHVQEHRREDRAAGVTRSATPAPAPRVKRGQRPIESVFGEAPAPSQGDGQPAPDPSPVSGEGPDAGAAPTPPRRSTPTIAAPFVRISPEQRSQSVSDAVRDAMPISTVADLLIAMSRSLSDLDGAGEAGVLSQIQATQVASLLYDATVDLVVTRFAGDVTKFKAGLAIILILVSKGTVHARAIGRKIEERRQITRATAQAAALGVNVEGDEPSDPFEAAKRREAAMIAAGQFNE